MWEKLDLDGSGTCLRYILGKSFFNAYFQIKTDSDTGEKLISLIRVAWYFEKLYFVH